MTKHSFGGTYRCVVPSCSNAFEHPDVGDCPIDEHGLCSHLTGAGWCTVWIRVYLHQPIAKDHLFSSGAWLCPACQARYLPQKGKR